MDWRNLALGHIMHGVLEVKNIFDFISFTRIFREFNTKTDSIKGFSLLA